MAREAKLLVLLIVFVSFAFTVFSATIYPDECELNIVNTTWSQWGDLTCVRGDYLRQSRSAIEYDANSCGKYEPVVYREYRSFGKCDYCVPVMEFTQWSDWTNAVCYKNNTLLQYRERLEFDDNACGEVEPIKHIETRHESCDYCMSNYQNTSWSDWTNYSCRPDNTMQQSRFLVEYDANFCGYYPDKKHTEYRIVGNCEYCISNLINSTWSNWENDTCMPGDVMRQTRRLTQIDTNFCLHYADKVFYEYRNGGYCDYCEPNYMNITVGSWEGVACLTNGSMWQRRQTIQFDLNSCGDRRTPSFYEYMSNSTCPLCSESISGLCISNTSKFHRLNISNFRLETIMDDELYVGDLLDVKSVLMYNKSNLVDLELDYSLYLPNGSYIPLYNDKFKFLNHYETRFNYSLAGLEPNDYFVIISGSVEGESFRIARDFSLLQEPVVEEIKREFPNEIRMLTDLMIIIAILFGIVLVYRYQFKKYGKAL